MPSSSAMGSMALSNVFSFAPGAAYKVSKAALNMLTRQYALAFSEDGITFIAVSPGVGSCVLLVLSESLANFGIVHQNQNGR